MLRKHPDVIGLAVLSVVLLAGQHRGETVLPAGPAPAVYHPSITAKELRPSSPADCTRKAHELLARLSAPVRRAVHFRR